VKKLLFGLLLCLGCASSPTKEDVTSQSMLAPPHGSTNVKYLGDGWTTFEKEIDGKTYKFAAVVYRTSNGHNFVWNKQFIKLEDK
jgi:hypothetical protein